MWKIFSKHLHPIAKKMSDTEALVFAKIQIVFMEMCLFRKLFVLFVVATIGCVNVPCLMASRTPSNHVSLRNSLHWKGQQLPDCPAAVESALRYRTDSLDAYVAANEDVKTWSTYNVGQMVTIQSNDVVFSYGDARMRSPYYQFLILQRVVGMLNAQLYLATPQRDVDDLNNKLTIVQYKIIQMQFNSKKNVLVDVASQKGRRFLSEHLLRLTTSVDPNASLCGMWNDFSENKNDQLLLHQYATAVTVETLRLLKYAYEKLPDAPNLYFNVLNRIRQCTARPGSSYLIRPRALMQFALGDESGRDGRLDELCRKTMCVGVLETLADGNVDNARHLSNIVSTWKDFKDGGGEYRPRRCAQKAMSERYCDVYARSCSCTMSPKEGLLCHDDLCKLADEGCTLAKYWRSRDCYNRYNDKVTLGMMPDAPFVAKDHMMNIERQRVEDDRRRGTERQPAYVGQFHEIEQIAAVHPGAAFICALSHIATIRDTNLKSGIEKIDTYLAAAASTWHPIRVCTYFLWLLLSQNFRPELDSGAKWQLYEQKTRHWWDKVCFLHQYGCQLATTIFCSVPIPDGRASYQCPPCWQKYRNLSGKNKDMGILLKVIEQDVKDLSYDQDPEYMQYNVI
ncbi:MAG: hypothetical protein LBR89_02515 [Holosporales bacterium]|jgi:hypothetical protein|nr:hypothetical protein [Holosporales bacterium]